MKPEHTEVANLHKYMRYHLQGPTRFVQLQAEAGKLVRYLNSQGLKVIGKGAPSAHVGRVIVDAVMQVRWRYGTHVRPRVRYIKNMYPKQAATVSGLLGLINSVGARNLLTNDKTERPWNGAEEQARLYKHALFFYTKGIDTFARLSNWLESDWKSGSPEKNRDSLMELDGVAHKTADYYRVLVGNWDAFAVDKFMRGELLGRAGIDSDRYSYKEKRTVYQLAAILMDVRPLDLDQSLYRYEIEQ
ncbi:MAG: hypothetical protein ISS52_01450 [Dehalococcoidia bacterium]|nr:hypothetical protein [Dehalococcoidia bacterium]